MKKCITYGQRLLACVAVVGVLGCDEDPPVVMDINEAPEFRSDSYTFSVAVRATPGVSVGGVAADDSDPNDDAALTYRILSPTDSPFEIDASSGLLSVMTGAVLGDVGDVHTLRVEVSDNDAENPLTDEASVTINVVEAIDYLNGNTLLNINTLEQLDAMRYDLDGDGMVDDGGNTSAVAAYATAFPGLIVGSVAPTGYELAQSLDFEDTESYASGTIDKGWSAPEEVAGWVPIGSYRSAEDNSPFSTTFDGNDYTIANLYIDRSGSYVGLFGYVVNSEIRRVGLEDVSITGNFVVGGLAGFNQDGPIEGCYVTGSITARDNFVGGLVGENFGSTITACYFVGSVSAANGVPVGGLAGSNVGFDTNLPVITECYAQGSVTGNGNVGGLVGDNRGIITKSYAASAVESAFGAGGLTGHNEGRIESCYTTGEVSGGGSIVGGIAGRNIGRIEASYATGDVTGSNAFTGGLVGVSDGTIGGSYATGNVSGTGSGVGGLVGCNLGSPGGENGRIEACYATGNVRGDNTAVGALVAISHATIVASYATGEVSGTGGTLGGLVGENNGMITASYFDFSINASLTQGSAGKTTTELQTPTDYADLYAAWNIDIDNVDGDDDFSTGVDDPWHFGSASEYPVLQIDFDEDGETADDVAAQRP